MRLLCFPVCAAALGFAPDWAVAVMLLAVAFVAAVAAYAILHAALILGVPRPSCCG